VIGSTLPVSVTKPLELKVSKPKGMRWWSLRLPRGAAHEGAHALAGRRPLGVGAGHQPLHLGVQAAVDDGAVEVQGHDAPLGHGAEAHAVEAAADGGGARGVEGHQLLAVLGPALHAVAAGAAHVERHLARLVLAVVRLVAPDHPAGQRPQHVGALDAGQVGLDRGHGRHARRFMLERPLLCLPPPTEAGRVLHG
jgi:hypothetical protein